MVKLKYLLAIFLFFILSTGCKKNEDKFEVKENHSYEKIEYEVSNKKMELVLNFKSLNDFNKERVWKKINLSSIVKLGGLNNDLFPYPTQVKIDKYDNFYVMDNIDCSVKKFDKKGNFISKYGKKGKGPGEFGNAFDFDVSDEGIVAVISPNDNKFSVFNKEVRDVVSTDMSGNICFLTEDEIVYYQFMDPIFRAPLQKVNYKSNHRIGYQNFINTKNSEDENFNLFSFLLGDIHRFSDKKLVFISNILGYVICYNDKGNIEGAFSLINKKKNELKFKKGNFVPFPRKKEYIFIVSNVYDNKLYILENNLKDEEDYIVDVYCLLERKYIYSMNLNKLGEIKYLFFTNEKLYLIRTNTELEIYNLKVDSENQNG